MPEEKIWNPSCHPGVLKPLETALSAGKSGQAVLSSATMVLTEISRKYGEMCEAELAFVGVDRSPLAQAAEAAFKHTATLVDKQRAAMETQRAHLEQSVASKLRAPSTDQRFADPCRSHIKGLQPSDRIPFLMRIINAGDLATVSAVLEGPAYLSGLDEDQRALVLATAMKRFAPAETKELQAVETAIGRVEAGAGAFVKKYADLLKASGDPRRDRASRAADVLKGARAS
jgi:hypothetical protein